MKCSKDLLVVGLREGQQFVLTSVRMRPNEIAKWIYQLWTDDTKLDADQLLAPHFFDGSYNALESYVLVAEQALPHTRCVMHVHVLRAAYKLTRTCSALPRPNTPINA